MPYRNGKYIIGACPKTYAKYFPGLMGMWAYPKLLQLHILNISVPRIEAEEKIKHFVDRLRGVDAYKRTVATNCYSLL